MSPYPICISLLFAMGCHGQHLDSIYDHMLASRSNREYSKMLVLNQKALQVHPSHPRLLYQLAAGYSLVDSVTKSYQTLRKLWSWNSTIDYRTDTDFSNLFMAKGYTAYLDTLKTYYQRQTRVSTDYTTLGGKRHFEDLVLMDSLLVMTDLYRGEVFIYHVEKEEIVATRTFELPVMALASLSGSSTVWVSTARLPQYEQNGSSTAVPEIVEIDPIHGNIITRIPLKADVLAGSMVFDNTGRLYMSNSNRPEVLVFDTSTKRLLKTIPIEEAFNLQGVTMDLERGCLYVSDYIKGIARIDLAQHDRLTWLTSPDFLLKGIDGLTYVAPHTLLAIQNNSTPKRVVGIQLRSDTVESVTLLDNHLDTKGEPTNGKFYKGLGFLYISNSPWPHYDDYGAPMLQDWEAQKILRISEDQCRGQRGGVRLALKNR